MRQAARSLWAWTVASIDAQDIVLLVGVGVLSVGAAQVYQPFGLIVPGGALTWLAWPKRPSVVVKPRQES